jgi:3-dehydroquinate synthase
MAPGRAVTPVEHARAQHEAGEDGIDWRRVGGAFDVRVRRAQVYRILVERGALSDLGDLLQPVMDELDADSAVVISDDRVPEVHVRRACSALERGGIAWQRVTVPAGERSKSMTTGLHLVEHLKCAGVVRRTTLIALGGGMICDLVGCVASLYMRGIPYANVPTSLMAQVDAAVGGKVGVDHQTAKNFLGAFYHPSLVLVDPLLLTTLGRRELLSGLAEVVKVAVIAAPELVPELEDVAGELTADADAVPVELLTPIVERAIEVKLLLLEDDPFERSLRRLLNFGHCIAHALEAASNFEVYRHGEAVAIGMATCTQIAVLRGVCSASDQRRLVALLRRLQLPTVIPEGLRDATWERLEVIQRIRNGHLHMVVPRVLGDCEILDELERGEYLAALTALENQLVCV